MNSPLALDIFGDWRSLAGIAAMLVYGLGYLASVYKKGQAKGSARAGGTPAPPPKPPAVAPPLKGPQAMPPLADLPAPPRPPIAAVPARPREVARPVAQPILASLLSALRPPQPTLTLDKPERPASAIRRRSPETRASRKKTREQEQERENEETYERHGVVNIHSLHEDLSAETPSVSRRVPAFDLARLAGDRDRLKQAFVLSEVLARPIALRDEQK